MRNANTRPRADRAHSGRQQHARSGHCSDHAARLRGGEALCLLLLAAAVVAAAAVSGSRPLHDVPYAVSVRVQEAQTLWTLAEEHPIDGRSTEQTVETIRRLNGLEGNTLAVGTQLLVPTTEPPREGYAAR